MQKSNLRLEHSSDLVGNSGAENASWRSRSATKFLQSKIKGPIKVSGNRIEIEEQQGLDVKLLLHKFLHHEGLTGYRVLSESGTLRIVPDDKPAYEAPGNDKIKGVPPFPPFSTERLPLLDVVYPNYASDRLERPRKLKKGND